MTWLQFLTVVLANIGWSTTMFLWLRKEANADRKELSAAINEGRKDMAEFKVCLSVIDERIRKL